jgi:hypothetical protein
MKPRLTKRILDGLQTALAHATAAALAFTPEGAPETPGTATFECHFHGMQYLYLDRPVNVPMAACCRAGFAAIGVVVPLTAAPYETRRSERVARAWRRLEIATGLSGPELKSLSLLQAAALMLDAHQDAAAQRERHTELAAGSAAVADEFYRPCQICTSPVDVRSEHVQFDRDRSDLGTKVEHLTHWTRRT